MAELDWSLLKQPTDPVTAYVGGLQAGRGIAKENALLAGLRTYDPANSGDAIRALVQSGNLGEANALAQIGFQQQQRQILSLGYNKVLNATQGSPPATPAVPMDAQPPAPTAAAPDPTAAPSAPAPASSSQAAAPSAPQIDPASLSPDQLAKISTITDAYDQAGIQLAGLPYQDRKAALASMAPGLVAHGVPQAMIDSFDPTDENIAAEHAKAAQLRGQIGATTAGTPMPSTTAPPSASPPPAQMPTPTMAAPQTPMAGPGGPQPPSSPQDAVVPTTSVASSTHPRVTPSPQKPALDLRNPDVAQGLELMAFGGADIGSLVNLATATTPKVDSARAGTFGKDQYGQITGATDAQGRIRGIPNSDGSVPIFDPSTGEFSIETAPGATDTESALAEAKAKGQGRGELAYAQPLAKAKASGEAQGTAPFDMISVPMPGGKTQLMSKADFQTLQRLGVAPGLGQTQTTAEAANAAEGGKGDATNFNQAVATYASPAAVMKEQNARDIATQAVHYAQSLDPNHFTPDAAKWAGVFNGLGFKPAANFANDTAYYQSLLPQVLRGTFSTFPRLEKEFEVVQHASASMATPKDAATMLLATQTAIHNRNLAYSDSLSHWPGDSSLREFSAAFNSSPAGKASIFADPIWRGITLGGKPAVYISQTPYQGHTYGVFRPGTPQAQSFLVQ
jgi:hypothetical protein